MLRTVSFAAVRSWRWPWVTPRISRGAVLAVTTFSFARWRGKSAPRRGCRAASGKRAALGLFGADTSLTGGVDAGGFDLFSGVSFPVFFYLLAGNLAHLLHGEICVLLDDRI